MGSHSTVSRRHRDERGVAAVEFAFLLPIIVVVLFGITAFGLAFNRFVTYLSAAREGARLAAVHCQPQATQCTNQMIVDRVTGAAVGYPIGPGTPTADRDCTLSPGEVVTVRWSQRIPIVIPMLPDLSTDVEIKGAFRCE